MKPSSSPAAIGTSMKNRNTTIKKLTLALLVAAVVNVPSAEAILIPLPGGGLQSGVPYVFRISANATDVAVMLQAVVRNRLELEDTATVPAGNSIDPRARPRHDRIRPTVLRRCHCDNS